MTEPRKMSDLWDQRYGTAEYAYGKKANAFFSSSLEHLPSGHILLPGEGEGRNAVYAASRGWRVDAFDQSFAGRTKAQALASERGVEISYQVCHLEEFAFPEMYYDAVALLFFHLDPVGRAYLHKQVSKSLKPGGYVILEGFHKEQLNKNTGGPKSLEMLFDERTLAVDFEGLEAELLEKRETTLDEGPYHQGEASVIRYLGRKLN
jgi:SAM-dependent methyltransferase